jgi:hypothetical protein
MQMFESSVGAVEEAAQRGMQVFDLAELVEMSVAFSRPAAQPAADPSQGEEQEEKEQ